MNHQILTFFIVSFFLVISLGPNMALIIDNATRLEKKRIYECFRIVYRNICAWDIFHIGCINAHSQ